ncbi:peptide deformylase [Photobacterium sp. CCB-ST2H9]|uniref:peptide deformylase n=1 Tax=unclassified Photobacterium TaxID=2628852 RepID=UPI00200577A2|nr:peptide deformylase [Photobacterium sp. CCB-ST2H9]UTM59852.1 peptide deformylase [Photobacterium sp. CCB-ST2H9]
MKIAQLGNPILRQQAKALTSAQWKEYAPFFSELQDLMLSHQGVGIAAPQVSESVRAFIVASSPNARYPLAPAMEPTLMLNPEIYWMSEDIEKDWEGCLSIPGMRALVPRSTTIKVGYEQLDGQKIQCELTGFIARIFQHEFDHLNGIVFLDRADSQDYATESEFRRQLGLN